MSLDLSGDKVNIDNGLVPSDNTPLSEPMLNQVYVAMGRP